MPLSQSQYIFGNSLVNHAGGGAYTNVPVWMDLFAEASGDSYAVSGGYGFLRDFADAPQPAALWGFSGVDASWEPGTETFEDAKIDTVLIAPANFIQNTTPDSNYAGDTRSPLDVTLDIVSELGTAQPTARIYLYEGWADMAAFADGVPADGQALSAYHAYNQEEYHAWYESLVDAVNAIDPDADVELLPVGSILSELLSGPLASIPPTELYSDTAPHGTETLYFLSAMVTYQASYGAAPVLPETLPADIHPTVLAEFDTVNTVIAARLEGLDVGEPTTPAAPPEDPDEPEAPVTDPDEPEAPVTDPDKPEAPVTDPDEPEDPGTVPEEPEVPEANPEEPVVVDPEPDEPAGPLLPPAPTSGFAVRYYDLGPDVSTLEEVDFAAPADRVGQVDTPRHFYTEGEIGQNGANDHVAAIYSQTLDTDSGGTFTVNLQADDHAQVWIDGTLVLDSAEAPLETLMTAEVALGAGRHEVELRYLELTGEATLIYDMNQTAPLSEDDPPDGSSGTEILALLSRTADDQGFSAEYEILRDAESEDDASDTAI